MVLYRGVEIGSELATSIRYMDQVEEYREGLQALQAVWDNLALLGHLSGTRIEIGEVRSAFSGLTTRLLNSLGSELRRKAMHDLQAKAQVAIDILVRNLFERTADIGFLATDSDLRAFAAATSDERQKTRAALVERFREYQRKYSVYSNIILMSPTGELLVQLDDNNALSSSRDPLIEECLATSAAYVESYRRSDLQPGDAKSLIYSYRVTANDGSGVVGVLCLVFRFDDECRRIFEGLIGRTDWCVITLVDQQGRVIASSDEHQASLGARIAGSVEAKAQVVRFGGRPFLSTVCKTSGYQGYMGPGWSGHAMLPLEFAFAAEEEESTLAHEISATDRARIMASETLFSQTLRDIPISAGRIQGELDRAVWNGNVALARGGGTNTTFSKTLLREIGHTGMRTRDVFSNAIGNMNQTVVSATLRECRGKAALAIDIMDRNLYERANDCRWWALTTAFRQTLAAPQVDAAARAKMTDILETINRLYTVYTNLVVFDANGCIVASSNHAYRERVGTQLEHAWVRTTLSLPTTESYCVSAFEPSELYENRHTYVYCAAIRAMGRSSRVIGGIAIVFDAEPQFSAMLDDTLPRNERGEIKAGAFGVLVDSEGRVVASSRPTIAIGSRLALDGGADEANSWERVVAFEDGLYALGACRSNGYREYKGEADPYKNEIISLVYAPLALGAADSGIATPPRPSRNAVRHANGENSVDLASFAVGGKWYAVPAATVVEAVRPSTIAVLPGAPVHIRGCAMVRDGVLLVVDLPCLLGTGGRAQRYDNQFIVILRETPETTPFGLLVDELGDTLEIERARLMPTQLAHAEGALVESVITPDASGDAFLLVLSTERLAACGRGIRLEQLSA